MINRHVIHQEHWRTKEIDKVTPVLNLVGFAGSTDVLFRAQTTAVASINDAAVTMAGITDVLHSLQPAVGLRTRNEMVPAMLTSCRQGTEPHPLRRNEMALNKGIRQGMVCAPWRVRRRAP